jgi:peptidoglycan hydrolase-like protein with peptidoglycan-binding domain
MKRIALILGAVVLVVAGAAVGTTLPLLQSDDGDAAAAATPPIPFATSAVVQRTMTVTEEFDGTLGYAGEGVIIAGLSGTYTKLPAEGDILTLGDEIYEVDGADSSYLMYGSRPAWRPLSKQVDGGADVKQLEQSLKQLGHARDNLKPDRKYQEATKKAVKKWQRRTDQKKDGKIAAGEVTFLPGDVRITEVVPELGTSARPGNVLARTSGTELVVTIDLEADRRDIVSLDDAVLVEMPDGSEAAGTIVEIDTVASSIGGSDPTIGVTIVLSDEAARGDLDGADVTVSVVRQTRPNVMTVPVDALIALREGGYALEIAEAGGDRYLVAVEVGLFDDSGVEVRGDIRVGDEVVVPA